MVGSTSAKMDLYTDKTPAAIKTPRQVYGVMLRISYG